MLVAHRNVRIGRVFALILACQYIAIDEAEACEPAIRSAKDVLNESSAVAIGYVTGEHYPDYESAIAGGRSPDFDVLWGKRVVRGVLIEYVKGNGPKVFTAEVPCGHRLPAVKGRTIVEFSASGSASIVAWPKEAAIRQAGSHSDD